MKKVICLASNNPHKVEELKKLLGSTFEIKTLEEIGCFVDIPETADSLEGNSLLKAQYVFDKFGFNSIADDSGLEVEALNGEPGVYSARYAGEHGDHSKNMAKLLKKLEGKANKKARFRTVVTLILAGRTAFFEGIVDGHIINEKRGQMGFGYDPIFIPEGHSKTFAEMELDEKIPISHRGKAVAKLINYLKIRA